jgi:hypothetical protein
MEDLFFTELCEGLRKPSQPRSVLQGYFESCYERDRKYDTPPPTPPTKKHTLDRVEAVAGTLFSKKRKHDDEEEDHDEVRQELLQPRYRRVKHCHVSSPSMISLPQKPPPHRKPSRVDFINQDKKLKHESDDKAPRERPQQQLDGPYLRRSNLQSTSSASTPLRPRELRPHARRSNIVYRGHVNEAKQHYWNADDQAKVGLMRQRALGQKFKPGATRPEEPQHKLYLLRTRCSRVLRRPRRKA